MKKRISVLFVFFAMLLGCYGCGTSGSEQNTGSAGHSADYQPAEETVEDQTDAVEQNVALNKYTDGIEVFGNEPQKSENQINCQWSGSGIAFAIDHTGGDVQIRVNTSNPCYFRVYVDGETWLNNDMTPYYEINGVKNLILTGIPAGKHTVRLIRVSDRSAADACLYSYTYTGVPTSLSVSPTAGFAVDFIGSGFAAGIGLNDGAHGDITQAYPYLTGEGLEADICIRTVCGSGILTGSQTAPEWFAELGAPERPVEIVVVDFGYEDYLYYGGDETNADTFLMEYQAFLKQVKSVYGATCKLICISVSGEEYFGDQVRLACEELGGESAGYFICEMPVCAGEYPSAEEHMQYSSRLITLIEKIRDLEIVADVLDVLPEGYGIEILYDSKEW